MALSPRAAAAAILVHIVAEQLGRPADTIKPEHRFVYDLGADSLDLVELCIAVEDEFNVEIPDPDADKLHCIDDVLAWLGAHGALTADLITPVGHTPSATQPATSEGNSPTPPTLQELFDRAVLGVLTQGVRSFSEGTCCYRGDGGAKCAVGHLISDEVYDSYRCDRELYATAENELEGKILSYEIVQRAVAQSVGAPLSQRAIDMLTFLQKAHDAIDLQNSSSDQLDTATWLRHFWQRANEIRDVYGLEVTRGAWDAYYAALQRAAGTVRNDAVEA